MFLTTTQVSANTHKVVAGDTVSAIALAHHKTVAELIQLNDLDFGGHLIFVGNDLKLDEPKPSKPSAQLKTELPKLAQRNQDINQKQNTYPFGQCTWYVKASLGWVGNFWGNAKDWANSAKKVGYQVTGQPQVGSVAVFSANLHGADATYGHVAIVEQVNADGTILISEGNTGRGLYNTRTVPTASVQFIHPHH
jgi:surface antigen